MFSNISFKVVNKSISLLIFFILLSTNSFGKHVFTGVDTIDYYRDLAESHFLEGRTAEALNTYTKALDVFWHFKDASSQVHQDEYLKLVEILTITHQDVGACELPEKYFKKCLTPTNDPLIVTNIVKDLIHCKQVANAQISLDLQSKILQFFGLHRIDKAADTQLGAFLSSSYSDEQEFDNFFYLLGNGFVPALQAMEKEVAAEKKAKNLGRTILTGLLIIATLIFIIYSREKNREHLKREKIAILEGREKETNRLSIDLHDILGYKIVELKEKVVQLNKNDTINMTDVSNGLDELHQSMRYIVQSNLTPQSLKFGLSPALDTLFNRMNALGIIDFQLFKHGLVKKIDASKEKHFFYIIQELANNIIKHSKGSTATFEITRYDKELTILAEDNGIGYQPSINTLKTVKARTSFLNGKVIEDSELDKGTTIIVTLPL